MNGIKLFYDVQGSPEDEPLRLIAAFNSDISIWSALIPVLVKQYRVIRFDNRGIGQSSALDGSYSIQQLAANAIALLDHLEIPQAYMVGHSMGGQIAQELALAYPTRMQSLDSRLGFDLMSGAMLYALIFYSVAHSWKAHVQAVLKVFFRSSDD